MRALWIAVLASTVALVASADDPRVSLVIEPGSAAPTFEVPHRMWPESADPAVAQVTFCTVYRDPAECSDPRDCIAVLTRANPTEVFAKPSACSRQPLGSEYRPPSYIGRPYWVTYTADGTHWNQNPTRLIEGCPGECLGAVDGVTGVPDFGKLSDGFGRCARDTP